MAHTREQRDKLRTPLCGAKARTTGKPCRNFAGQGTEHLGYGKCAKHGGNTRSHRTKAAKEIIRSDMAALGKPVTVTPGQLMAAVVHLSAGHLYWLTKKLQELQDEDSEQARAVLTAWSAERDRSARVAKLAADAGVDERMASLAEEHQTQVVRLIEGVARELGLTKQQLNDLGPAVRRQLAVIEGTAQESTRPKGRNGRRKAA